jgi:hypothetical protein
MTVVGFTVMISLHRRAAPVVIPGRVAAGLVAAMTVASMCVGCEVATATPPSATRISVDCGKVERKTAEFPVVE